MRTFRFRAGVVLDLRRKRDEEAQRAIVLARGRLSEAEQLRGRALEAVAAALEEARQGEAQGGEVAILMWYRNWILRQRRAVAACEQVVEARHAALNQAIALGIDARRDLRVIEKMRERAWRAWQLDQRREDQKALDLMGSLQHAARRIAPGGQS